MTESDIKQIIRETVSFCQKYGLYVSTDEIFERLFGDLKDKK